MKDSSKKRHIAKTITWRLIGTLDTIILSWLISGNPFTGLKIGVAEVITKLALYYFHERFWYNSSIANASKRHIIKTITWRFIGTLDTFLIAWIISGDMTVGIQIGVLETVTKMILYYIHEKTWYKLNYGLASRKNND